MNVHIALRTLYPYYESTIRYPRYEMLNDEDDEDDAEEEGEKIRSLDVESVSSWRSLAKCEKDAHLSNDQMFLPLPLYHCHLCGCCIGPGYYEQYLYFYPIFHEWIKVSYKRSTLFFEHEFLFICETCAQYHYRQLPLWLCVVQPIHYETTLLLCEENEIPQLIDFTNVRLLARIRRALNQYIGEYIQFFFFLFLFAINIPFTWIFRTKEESSFKKKNTRSKKKPLSFDIETLPPSHNAEEEFLQRAEERQNLAQERERHIQHYKPVFLRKSFLPP